MRAILWIGGLVIVGVIVFIAVPSFNVQNAGSATLVAVNGSTTIGTATLTPVQGGQATQIDVQAQHLVPMSTHAISIHDGSCRGELLAALFPIVADSSGSGSSSTTLSAQAQSSWFIVLHTGTITRDSVLACGQVVLNAVIITVTPQPINTPNIPGQFPNTGGGPPQP